MKKILLTLQSFSIVAFLLMCCTLLTAKCFAQAGEWTWMKGDSTSLSAGVFGTQGIPSVNNNPPAVYEASEWKGKDGTFWCFGGLRFGPGAYNDVWRYDIQTNEWTWMNGSGSTNASPVFGIQGSFAPANTPGSQQWCAASWVDTAGNFWLFGGAGIGAYNLLWEYDPSLNQWAWMRGSTLEDDPGSYGVQGVPSASNDPRARWETNATWTDKENNLWLFGGLSASNDLWKYNIATNEWTWMSGSNLTNQHATYGTLGVADPANVPGSRYAYAKWIDDNQNLWLFGGEGWNASSFGDLNDLWKYDIATNEWTWMSGTNHVDDSGLSGPLCNLSPGYRPSARWETRACWLDMHDNFWLYGGYSEFYGAYYGSQLNDMWVYVPDSNAWALVSTSSVDDGLYGTQGVSTSFTHPPSKMGALAYTDPLGNLWLFNGGWSGPSERNDLWKYVIDPNCPFILYDNPGFNASDTSLCEKFCISFADQSNNNPTSWQWYFQGGDPSSSTDQNPTNICYNLPGTYDVTLITISANGSDTLTLPNYITVYPTPPTPVITQVNNILTSSPASSYQWQFNSINISGATNQSYTVLQSGLYTVIAGDTNGCYNSANLDVLINAVDEVNNDANISVYPNPSSGNFTVELVNEVIGEEVSLEVVNTVGQKIFTSGETISAGYLKKEIDLSDAASGVYFIKIKTKSVFLRQKILITQ